MGLETAALIGLGSGVSSAIGGAVQGLKGTPDQRTFQEQQTILGDKTPEQVQLEQESMRQFQEQLAAIDAQQQALQDRSSLASAGQSSLESILGGQAFALTPEEEARINQLQQAQVAQGTEQINRLLTDRLAELQRSAGQRNVRGQALSQLQTGALEAGANSLTDLINQASVNAASQQLQLPGQRAGLQAQVGQNALSLTDALRQQAIANRQSAQNPAMLNALRSDRQAQATTKASSLVPGQKGSIGSAILGGLGGAAGGLKAGTGIAAGLEGLGAIEGKTATNFLNSLRDSGNKGSGSEHPAVAAKKRAAADGPFSFDSKFFGPIQ